MHWVNHKINLPNFGFEVKGVWIGNTPAIANQVIAIVSFPDNEDVEAMTECYFKSPEYIKLMEGFDRSNFTNVETIIINPRRTEESAETCNQISHSMVITGLGLFHFTNGMVGFQIGVPLCQNNLQDGQVI